MQGKDTPHILSSNSKRFDYMILNVFAKIEMSIEILSYIEIKDNVRILF